MAIYVALLRGINVGGKNLIKMPALKECFERGGFDDVSTYIQTGNVLFRATGPASALEGRIEKMLTQCFDHEPTVMVRSRTQMRAIVDKAPKGFGSKPDRYLSDVAFLKGPLTAAAVVKEVATREGVDEISAGPGVLYISRLRSRASQSRLSRMTQLPVYKNMTLRSWSTTTRLLGLMDQA